MKKIIEYLTKLDFSETEAKIYLVLLEKGSMTVSELAEKAKINRTATYGYINNLLEKGVIAKSKGESNKVIANPPEQLYYLVDEKLSAAKTIQEELAPVITTLNQSFLRSINSNNSHMKYFKGRAGIRTIYNDCLQADKIRSYFNPREIKTFLPENIGLFEKSLLKNPKMQIYEIVEDSTQARARYKQTNTKRHYWKFLPKDIKLSSNDILIYHNKVAIINILGEDNFHGSIFENIDYYNNSKQLFDLLWRFLPEPEPLFSK